MGQRVKVLPSGVESTIARIVTFDGDLDQEAGAGEAVTLVLKDEIEHQPRRPAGLTRETLAAVVGVSRM